MSMKKQIPAAYFGAMVLLVMMALRHGHLTETGSRLSPILAIRIILLAQHFG